MSNLEQRKKADEFRRRLGEADLSGAEIAGVEQELVKILAGAPSWKVPSEIAPLAEPVDMDAMAGEPVREVVERARMVARGSDALYGELVEANNSITAEIESAEKAIVAATDSVQALTSLIQDQASQYVWVSDTFNDNLKIDLARSTAFVDTDYGQATLGPVKIDSVKNLDPDVVIGGTEGIPGCNLLILDLKGSANTGTTSADSIAAASPYVTKETSATTNLSNLGDGSASTWFEFERNFIPKTQDLRMGGHSFVFELGAKNQDVMSVTKGLDWKAVVNYPDGRVMKGDDGSGVMLAEMIEPTIDPRNSEAYDARLELVYTLPTPQELSEIRINPMVRPKQGKMLVDRVEVVADGRTILVARDKELKVEQTEVRRLQREVLRRTGSDAVGASFQVPTNRKVSSVRIKLRGKPAKTPNGLAHPYKVQHVEQTTTRTFLFISSSDNFDYWERIALNANPPKIDVKRSTPSLLGSLGGPLGQIGSSGLLGSWASPILMALGPISDIIDAAFGTTTTRTTVGEATGSDVFSGFRASVSIRDITLGKVDYEETSELYSSKLVFPRAVTKVGLVADYSVPDDWAQGRWITFYLSDDGVNWTEVSPLTDTNIEASYTLPEPGDSVYFRASFRRDAADRLHTPKLHNYALQGVPL